MPSWDKDRSRDEIAAAVNASERVVKVLAADKMDISGKSQCEGVWVYIIDGDQENGVGFLMSNIVSVDIPASRGDVVQYRTTNPGHKPYITVCVDGRGN
jgi:hypothetical protein